MDRPGRHPLHDFFQPESVAVIGASSKPGKVGYAIMSNLVLGAEGQLGGGFRGKVYPVNPAGGEIFRHRAYRKVGDIPDRVDLAVIAVPAAGVLDVMEECAAKGVKAVILISSGFSESGADGKARERLAVELARGHGMRLLGPNCLGVINTSNRLNTTFAKKAPPRGPISFVSQSGAICTSVIEYSSEEYMGFANFVSIGNKCDLDDADIIEYYAEDPET